MELAKQVDENKIDDLRRQISESELNFETVLEAAIEKVSCLTEIEMETGILVLLHTFLFDDLKYKMEICLRIPSGLSIQMEFQNLWTSNKPLLSVSNPQQYSKPVSISAHNSPMIP